MKLFTHEQVAKFFSILGRMGRCCNPLYKGYNSKNPEYEPCAKQVFVNRTLNRFLKNKYVILYVESKQTGLEYKQYCSITKIEYHLGYGEEIKIYLYDYTKPGEFWNSITIGHNDALQLEGEWCEGNSKHHQLLKLLRLDIPEKEYVFSAYDWSKYPKRRKKGQTDEDIENSLRTTISFRAKTEKQAFIRMNEYRESDIENKLIITGLLEVKD